MNNLGLHKRSLRSSWGVVQSVNRWENGRAKPLPLALRQIEALLEQMGDRGRACVKHFGNG